MVNRLTAVAAMGLCALIGPLSSATAATPQASEDSQPSVNPSTRIVGGTADNQAHPYAAAVLRPGAKAPNCSGVLIATKAGWPVVLTDAHCLHPGGRLSGTGARVAFASQWRATGVKTYTGTFRIDPQYNPAKSKLHDIAIIVPTTRPSVRTATLASPGLIDKVRPTRAVVVGFGKPYSGTRRSATEKITSWTADWLNLVPGTGNTCDGDSGAADLLFGTDIVMALTDQGTCSWDRDTRVDNAATAAFVNSATRSVLKQRRRARAR
ncbi:MAG: trypsin-like serine protease [Actinomycetes bacterium]